jgi:predicted PurR-regulated permease PerM
MALVGIATATGLWLLGVPLAFTLGVVAGVVSFVPTIGAVLAIIPALLVAFQQGAWMPAYVLALYCGVQAVENNLITPLVQQKAVSVPPVLVIVVQVLMGLLVGIVGVAIATPLAAVGLQLIRDLYVREKPHESPRGRTPGGTPA